MPPPNHSTLGQPNGRLKSPPRLPAASGSVDSVVKKVEHLIGEYPIAAATLAASLGLLAAWWMKRR